VSDDQETLGIILTGYPKSGKTTYSKLLAKHFSLNHLSLDSIISAFEGVYPELNINHDVGTLQSITQALQPFAFKLIEQQLYYRVPFILDGYHLDIEELQKHFSKQKILIIGLGYPDLNAEEKLEDVRANPTKPNWTALFPDNELIDWFTRVIPKNKIFQEKCYKLDIDFYNVSQDFWQTYNFLVKRVAEFLEYPLQRAQPTNILIGGMPRCGKTTMASNLVKRFNNLNLNFNHVCQSSLHRPFKILYPELQIHSDGPTYSHVADQSAPFFFQQCEWYATHGTNFVGDGYFFRPEHLLKHTFTGGLKAVFLGYKTTDPDYAANLIRSQEREFDWTKSFTFEQLKSDLSRFKEASISLELSCQELGYPYYELGNSWPEVREKVFNDLFWEKVKKN
jgi:uridine kinase